MLKILCHNDETKRPLLILGLSEINLLKLAQGNPVPIKVDDVVPGVALDVLIMGGKTEQAMLDEFKKMGWDMDRVPRGEGLPSELEHIDIREGPHEAH